MLFGDNPLRLATIGVSDIIKRHTVNKDTCICIKMYGVACGFSSEGPC